MIKEIVVSRYKEIVYKWIKNVPPDVRITLYNKAPQPQFKFCDAVLELAHRVECLPNIGREGHTYLHHIVHNYHNLADITFFSQGDPRPHLWGQSIPSFFDFEDATVSASKMRLVSNMGSRSKTAGWLLGNPMPDHIFTKKSNTRWGTVKPSVYTFPAWWETYVQLPIPDSKTVQFSWGGIFSVTKPYILSYSLDYYEQLLQTLSTDINPEEGHFLERAWSYIFNPKNE